MSSYEHLRQKYKKLLLSKKETAEELNISQATLDRLRKSGEIQSKRIGGGVFFHISQICDLIDS